MFSRNRQAGAWRASSGYQLRLQKRSDHSTCYSRAARSTRTARPLASTFRSRSVAQGYEDGTGAVLLTAIRLDRDLHWATQGGHSLAALVPGESRGANN